MANPTLTPFPTPPLPEQDEVTFNRNAANSLLAQANFVNEGNIVITWMGQQIDAAAASKKAAADSATAAGQSADSAGTQAGNAKNSADAAARSLASSETVAAAVRAQIALPSLAGQKGKFWRVAQDEKTLELADVTQTITKYFVSAAQQLVRGGSININHGLGQRPKIMSAYITCVTAEWGYSVGDVLEVSLAVASASDQSGYRYPAGMGVLSDATTITLLFHSFGIPINTKNNLSGAQVVFANAANWTISVRAFV
nr:hypothetical protein [uncultured Pseudomonas sp.]